MYASAGLISSTAFMSLVADISSSGCSKPRSPAVCPPPALQLPRQDWTRSYPAARLCQGDSSSKLDEPPRVTTFVRCSGAAGQKNRTADVVAQPSVVHWRFPDDALCQSPERPASKRSPRLSAIAHVSESDPCRQAGLRTNFPCSEFSRPLPIDRSSPMRVVATPARREGSVPMRA